MKALKKEMRTQSVEEILIDNIAWKSEKYRFGERVTYEMIQAYIGNEYNFKLNTIYVVEVKGIMFANI